MPRDTVSSQRGIEAESPYVIDTCDLIREIV